jgi:hypothetical protein
METGSAVAVIAMHHLPSVDFIGFLAKRYPFHAGADLGKSLVLRISRRRNEKSRVEENE